VVPRGKITFIIGRSGTGKSVTLKHIMGLLRPDAGHIWVGAEELTGMHDRALRRVRERFGFVFQHAALFDSMTVFENVEFPLVEHARLGARQRAEKVNTLLAAVGMSHAAEKYPSELSGGMRKRAGLARALALDPEVVFLDEPTAGLDPIGAAAFDDLIKNLQATLGLTVFMVTHDLDSLYAICDRIAVLAEKRVLVTGTIDELMQHAHPWIKEYFHGPRGRAAVAAKERNAQA
jgi:phospholipid/cholesterol/gamma-HCH transport system ATP-binding protein